MIGHKDGIIWQRKNIDWEFQNKHFLNTKKKLDTFPELKIYKNRTILVRQFCWKLGLRCRKGHYILKAWKIYNLIIVP